MLILSRKRNEEIVVGNNITITVLKITGGRVQIGVTAEDDVRIQRPERREVQTD